MLRYIFAMTLSLLFFGTAQAKEFTLQIGDAIPGRGSFRAQYFYCDPNQNIAKFIYSDTIVSLHEGVRFIKPYVTPVKGKEFSRDEGPLLEVREISLDCELLLTQVE